MFTVITGFLGRSENDFWSMTPRLVFAMIEQWTDIERTRSKIMGICIAAYQNGKDPDDYLGVKKKPVKKATVEQTNRANARFF